MPLQTLSSRLGQDLCMSGHRLHTFGSSTHLGLKVHFVIICFVTFFLTTAVLFSSRSSFRSMLLFRRDLNADQKSGL